jgi:hypothetical protein
MAGRHIDKRCRSYYTILDLPCPDSLYEINKSRCSVIMGVRTRNSPMLQSGYSVGLASCARETFKIDKKRTRQKMECLRKASIVGTVYSVVRGERNVVV